MDMFAAIIINSLIVLLVVSIHYEFLYRLTRILPKLQIRHRYRIAVGVLGAMTAHVIEIWVFAVAYYFMQKSDTFGSFTGNHTGSLSDCVYFSFTTYSTLGFGDIAPGGLIRFLTGIESLTGLVLITWTASFLYLEMQKNWDGN